MGLNPHVRCGNCGGQGHSKSRAASNAMSKAYRQAANVFLGVQAYSRGHQRNTRRALQTLQHQSNHGSFARSQEEMELTACPGNLMIDYVRDMLDFQTGPSNPVRKFLEAVRRQRQAALNVVPGPNVVEFRSGTNTTRRLFTPDAWRLYYGPELNSWVAAALTLALQPPFLQIRGAQSRRDIIDTLWWVARHCCVFCNGGSHTVLDCFTRKQGGFEGRSLERAVGLWYLDADRAFWDENGDSMRGSRQICINVVVQAVSLGCASTISTAASALDVASCRAVGGLTPSGRAYVDFINNFRFLQHSLGARVLPDGQGPLGRWCQEQVTRANDVEAAAQQILAPDPSALEPWDQQLAQLSSPSPASRTLQSPAMFRAAKDQPGLYLIASPVDADSLDAWLQGTLDDQGNATRAEVKVGMSRVGIQGRVMQQNADIGHFKWNLMCVLPLVGDQGSPHFIQEEEAELIRRLKVQVGTEAGAPVQLGGARESGLCSYEGAVQVIAGHEAWSNLGGARKWLWAPGLIARIENTTASEITEEQHDDHW